MIDRLITVAVMVGLPLIAWKATLAYLDLISRQARDAAVGDKIRRDALEAERRDQIV